MWVRVCGSGGRRSAIEEEKVVMEKQGLRAGGRKGKFHAKRSLGQTTARLVLCARACVRIHEKRGRKKERRRAMG